MKTESITRAQATELNIRKRCTFGVISENCLGVWGDGTTERTAIESAKKYFRANKRDFLRNDENGEPVFDMDAILNDCYIVRVDGLYEVQVYDENEWHAIDGSDNCYYDKKSAISAMNRHKSQFPHKIRTRIAHIG